MEQALRGVLAYKGERGYSAYEVAVKNGFIGTEQDWLATLGTSSHFSEDKVIHISTASQTVFDIPDAYTSNSFIDVYVNGLRLTTDEYTIDSTTKKITLTNALSAGAEVEIVVLTMSTNSLPIAETISESSTNETATGTKAVYDYVQNTKNTLNDTIEQLKNNVEAEKMDKSSVQVLTGSINDIAAGETAITDIDKEPCAHTKGKKYRKNGKYTLCYISLDNPTDAYEWSFVAVPAQKAAGVIKSFKFYEKGGEKNMDEILKALGSGKTLTLSENETKEVFSLIKNLKEKAESGEYFKEELKKEVIKLSGIVQPEISSSLIKSIADKISIKELTQFRDCFKERASKVMPLNPQFSSEESKKSSCSNTQFKL